jgi:hypothetical protein
MTWSAVCATNANFSQHDEPHRSVRHYQFCTSATRTLLRKVQSLRAQIRDSALSITLARYVMTTPRTLGTLQVMSSSPSHRRRLLLLLVLPVVALSLWLAYSGRLYPLLPKPIIRWWVMRATPLGTPYSSARETVARRGWRESSSSGPCIYGDVGGAHLSVELGHLTSGIPMVTYVFATYRFDSSCRLASIEIVKEVDAP